MGLIYVNPEGPGGNPDPLAAAQDIRDTFARMAMNDEETVALIVGGHTFGKSHGAAPAGRARRSGTGGQPQSRTRASAGRTNTATARAPTRSPAASKGAWTNNPTKWDNGFLENLFKYEWELTTSPAGAKQWTPKNPEAKGTVPDAHDPCEAARADDADDGPLDEDGSDLRADREALFRESRPARRCFRQGLVQAASSRHGSTLARYLGPWVPEPQLWQDPVPEVDHELIDEQDIAALKRKILASGLSIPELVSTAWDGRGQLPRHRQARRRERSTDPAGAAERLGGQRTGPAGEGAGGLGTGPAGFQQLAVRRQEGLAGRPDRAGRMRRGRAGGPKKPGTRSPFRSRRVAPTPRRSRPTWRRSMCSRPAADGFRNYFRAG